MNLLLDHTLDHPFHQLFISLLLGFLVGLQRQWVAAPLGGIRTFSLISVFGTLLAFIAASFGGWILVGGLVAVVSVIVVGNLSHKMPTDEHNHSPLTTEVAMLLMYAIGVLCGIGPLWLASAAAGILVIVLQLKLELHGLAKHFSQHEITAIMQFVLISLVILPVVPNQTFGPFDVLNPYEIWLMVILIVAISLAGYIVYKFFGHRAGTLLGGILGGLVSSTATTVTFSKRSKISVHDIAHNAIIIALAWSTLYVRLIVEIMVAAPGFTSIIVPLMSLAAVSFFTTFVLINHAKDKKATMPVLTNPSELKTALVFAVLFAVILFASAAAKHYFGNKGLMVTAFLSGLTDLDAITLTTSRLVHAGKLLQQEALSVILVANISNLLFKAGVAGVMGGKRLLKALALPVLATLAVIVVWLVWVPG